MATRTRADLAKRALQRLGKIQADEDPDSSDGALVEAEWADMLTWLKDDGLAYWPEDEIPSVVFPICADLLTNQIGPHFGIPYSPEAEEIHTRKLRRHMRKPASGEPTRGQAF